MLLKLRAGEKLYINGAVIRVERKATIELLNDATFLLEAHVIQPDEASTPLRQLYFTLQTELMDRDAAPIARKMFKTMLADTSAAFGPGAVAEGLREAQALAESGRIFEALKAIRALYPREAELLTGAPQTNAAA
ncbi:flagellar biosynthesis repressor FlbT [Rhodoblastus acidophilus]|uniref:Flagellar biosynthesis repressor FlbT n=1 Tax=Candidatus Rhodoblastus alkanivorans TaxID=2954117 RepID=A0ABS9Z3D1_9HYPH|nr:flagellar biosynthesis repressor FlbT [Candidatus Rhodoblastus alkanivorans]MCI4678795.1 flagellar biosynthesis repressor FlbT [Candidatus Rhodoblastus alkanivorans]MCI4682184.1 flagellar biosynthesis repressor FlbT [Candidatus Rhodoblastus alkanivorans]MDI4639486.1 flagellar biosynthesis repressor FlbT [Rhodoblastus acidophilus]